MKTVRTLVEGATAKKGRLEINLTVPPGHKICVYIDRRQNDEPWPLARYYFEPEDEIDWMGFFGTSISEGYSVTVTAVPNDRVGLSFDNRERKLAS